MTQFILVKLLKWQIWDRYNTLRHIQISWSYSINKFSVKYYSYLYIYIFFLFFVKRIILQKRKKWITISFCSRSYYQSIFLWYTGNKYTRILSVTNFYCFWEFEQRRWFQHDDAHYYYRVTLSSIKWKVFQSLDWTS